MAENKVVTDAKATPCDNTSMDLTGGLKTLTPLTWSDKTTIAKYTDNYNAVDTGTYVNGHLVSPKDLEKINSFKDFERSIKYLKEGPEERAKQLQNISKLLEAIKRGYTKGEMKLLIQGIRKLIKESV